MLNKIFLIPYFKSNIFDSNFKNRLKNIENNNDNIIYVFGKIPINIINFIKEQNNVNEIYFVSLDNNIIFINYDTNLENITCKKKNEHIFLNLNEKKKFIDSCILNKYKSICIIKGEISFFENELLSNSDNSISINSNNESNNENGNIISEITKEEDIEQSSSDKESINDLSTIINSDKSINYPEKKKIEESNSENLNTGGSFSITRTSKSSNSVLQKNSDSITENNFSSESLFSDITDSELNDIFKSDLNSNSNYNNSLNDLTNFDQDELSEKIDSNLFLSDLNFNSHFEKKNFEDFSEIFS